MKKKQNKPLGVSAVQIVVALSLISMSAVLLASGFRSAPSRGVSRSVGVLNPVNAGAQPAPVAKPEVVSPFSDEELAEQAAAEAELRNGERTKQSGFFQQQAPSQYSAAARPGDASVWQGVPTVQSQWQVAQWIQQQGLSPRDPSTWHAALAIQRALEWAPLPPAPPKIPRVTCTSLGSGNWSSAGTWSCGFVPTAADDVFIASGHTVTIDTAAVANNVTVNAGGILQYDAATARSLVVGTNLVVTGGGTFQANPAGVINTHSLSIGGQFTNGGTMDFSQNGNA